MTVSDSHKKSWLHQIDQSRKKILDISSKAQGDLDSSKAQRDIAYEEKKIADLERKLRDN